MSDPHLDKLRKWLAVQGYPLEMRVANTFREKNWMVRQSEYYPREKGFGEIDVAVWLQEPYFRGDSNEFFGSLQLLVAIECKSAAKAQHPWIAFTSAHHSLPSEYIIRSIRVSGMKNAHSFLAGAAKKTAIRKLPLFQLPERPAYAVVEGRYDEKSEGSPVAQKALDSAIAAAAAKTDLDGVLRLVVPVVVTAAPFYECFLNGTTLDILPLQRTTAVLYRGTREQPYVLVHVLSESVLPDFVRDVEATFRGLTEHASGEVLETYEVGHALRQGGIEIRSSRGAEAEQRAQEAKQLVRVGKVRKPRKEPGLL